VQLVYHLAAVGMDPLQQDVEEILRHNLWGTLRVLQLAERVAPERLVFCGSGHEYGAASRAGEEVVPAPVSAYGVSKTSGWMLARARAQQAELPLVSLRPFPVYGTFDVSYRLVPYCVRRALAGAPLEITGGEQTRDFVYVDDVVEAFLAAGTAPGAVGGTFNVCSGVETSVRELVETVVELTGCAAAPRFGTRPYRPSEMWHLSGDPARAAEVLGWRATTPLREGLERTIAWFRARRETDPDHLHEEAAV
jgi:nucleoside-diphosphate-sugar epimerase